MTSEEWYKRVGTGYIDIVLIIADLAAAEERAANAEERARLFADELDHDNSDYRVRAEQAEEKVAAYVKLLAQSSTQYREMVVERDEYRESWEKTCDTLRVAEAERVALVKRQESTSINYAKETHDRIEAEIRAEKAEAERDRLHEELAEFHRICRCDAHDIMTRRENERSTP
jgi:hypothetical protein